MADFSKLTPPGQNTALDVKDAVARQQLSQLGTAASLNISYGTISKSVSNGAFDILFSEIPNGLLFLQPSNANYHVAFYIEKQTNANKYVVSVSQVSSFPSTGVIADGTTLTFSYVVIY